VQSSVSGVAGADNVFTGQSDWRRVGVRATHPSVPCVKRANTDTRAHGRDRHRSLHASGMYSGDCAPWHSPICTCRLPEGHVCARVKLQNTHIGNKTICEPCVNEFSSCLDGKSVRLRVYETFNEAFARTSYGKSRAVDVNVQGRVDLFVKRIVARNESVRKLNRRHRKKSKSAIDFSQIHIFFRLKLILNLKKKIQSRIPSRNRKTSKFYFERFKREEYSKSDAIATIYPRKFFCRQEYAPRE